MSDAATGQLSISEAKRQVTTDRIRAGALELLMTEGLDITMDAIAAHAGISRATLFRHFDSRDALLAGAVQLGVVQLRRRLPTLDQGEDWRAWLWSVCDFMHGLQARFGRGYMELVNRVDVSAELEAVKTELRTERIADMTLIAETLWEAAGGRGPTPPALLAVVVANLSPNFTASIVDDAGLAWELAAEVALASIGDAVERVVAQTPSV